MTFKQLTLPIFLIVLLGLSPVASGRAGRLQQERTLAQVGLLEKPTQADIEFYLVEDNNVTKIHYITGNLAERKIGFGPVGKASTFLVIPGDRAQMRIGRNPPVFQCKLPPDFSPRDVYLVKFKAEKSKREIKIASGKIILTPGGGSSGAEWSPPADQVISDIEVKETEAKGYQLTPRRPLQPGEYGFLITPMSGLVAGGTSRGYLATRIYDFRVDQGLAFLSPQSGPAGPDERSNAAAQLRLSILHGRVR
jgi:hypothetical protein